MKWATIFMTTKKPTMITNLDKKKDRRQAEKHKNKKTKIKNHHKCCKLRKSSVCNSDGIKHLLIFLVKTFHIVILDGTGRAFGNSTNIHRHTHIHENRKKTWEPLCGKPSNSKPRHIIQLSSFSSFLSNRKKTLSNSGHCCSICM